MKGRKSFFWQLLLVCGGISVSAVLLTPFLVDSLVERRMSRTMGDTALAAATGEARALDSDALRSLAADLTGPAQPEETLGEWIASLPPEKAKTLRSLMASLDDPTPDDAPILPLDDATRARVHALSDAIKEAKDRQQAAGITAMDVLLRRGDHDFLIDAAQGDYPFVAIDPDSTPALHALKTAAREQATVTAKSYRDHWGEWISAYAPLRAATGEPVAVVEADVKLTTLPQFRASVRDAAWLGSLALAPIALTASLLLASRVSRRVARITSALGRVEQGDLGARVDDANDDELGVLAKAFNAMVDAVAENDRMRGILEESVSKPVARELLGGGRIVEREASVIFSDIRGFTAMSEDMPPSEVMSLLNAYFSEMTPVIERHGGFVDKFIGDGMLAVFGAPDPLEGHAPAAVTAALEMREALKAFNTRRAAQGLAPIEIGIGVNSGPITAGTLGSTKRRNYTVLGRTVNIAARLCSKALPMTIVVSAETAAKVDSKVVTRELEPLALKGITGPFRAFEVLAAR